MINYGYINHQAKFIATRPILQTSINLLYFLKMMVILGRRGFHGGSDGKASACNVGDPASIPGLGRSPGEGNGNPLQCSYLENPRDGGAWWAAVYGVAQSRTRLK